MTTDAPTALRLPPGMRSTRASRAVLALFAAAGPDATLSEIDVERALHAQEVRINRVTVYRLLHRLHAADVLLRTVDEDRVARYARSPAEVRDKTLAHPPRFECDGCRRQFRLAGQEARLQAALRALRQELQAAGHAELRLDFAVRGRCSGCARPAMQAVTDNSV